jgi:hypothetical protein
MLISTLYVSIYKFTNQQEIVAVIGSGLVTHSPCFVDNFCHLRLASVVWVELELFVKKPSSSQLREDCYDVTYVSLPVA